VAGSEGRARRRMAGGEAGSRAFACPEARPAATRVRGGMGGDDGGRVRKRGDAGKNPALASNAVFTFRKNSTNFPTGTLQNRR
jgi:hypothetical protein